MFRTSFIALFAYFTLGLGAHWCLGSWSFRRPRRHLFRLREPDPLHHTRRLHHRRKLSPPEPSLPLPIAEAAAVELQRIHLYGPPRIAHNIRVQGKQIQQRNSRTGLRGWKILLCRLLPWGEQYHHAVRHEDELVNHSCGDRQSRNNLSRDCRWARSAYPW